MRLALGLMLQPAAMGAAGAASSAISNITIMGATPLLDATNDYADATSRIGVNGNGWVCKATMPYLVGATFDPTKITLTLSDPGYTSGGSTTVPRTVRGGRVLRRQYNAAANLQASNDGVTFTVYFSLIGDNAEFATVYSGTTVSAASAATGFYGISASGAVSSLTNSSTLVYPKAIPTFINRQHDRCGAGGMYVELVAGHRHAMSGQQVARVEFIGTDSSAHTAATQTSSTPVLSTLVTKGNPPEVYAATVPVTALTQGDLCFVNFKVYPWIGDSSAIFDSATDGASVTGNYTTPTPATSLRFLNDKAGTYAVAHAAVQSGAVGGAVQASRAAAEATPFATVSAALAALPAYNNTHASHNDHSGAKIWLLNLTGSLVNFDPGDLSGITAGKCLTEIRASPSNTAAVALTYTGTVFTSDKLSWHCDFGAATGLMRNGNFLAYFNDGTHLTPANTSNYEAAPSGFHNVTFTGWMPDLAGSGADIGEMIGCVQTGAPSNGSWRGRVIIGCSFSQVAITDWDGTVTGKTSQDGKVICNNKFMKNTANCNLQNAPVSGGTGSYTRGMWIAQNVFERHTVDTTQPAMSLFGDGSVTPCDNIVLQSNTIIGNRLNVIYADVTGAAGVLHKASTRFNLIWERNTKSDLFTTNSTATGRNGNWEYVNGVGNWDVVINGSSGGGNTPADGAWIGEYWGPATYDVGAGNVTFTADASTHGTQAGGGTYSLTGGSNAAYATVPTGKCPFKFDIAGTARRTDGTGASGAYERP